MQRSAVAGNPGGVPEQTPDEIAAALEAFLAQYPAAVVMEDGRVLFDMREARYALSTEKLMRETGWKAQMPFEAGLRATIDWYRNNAAWIARVKSGEYQSYYQRNYANRAV